VTRALSHERWGRWLRGLTLVLLAASIIAAVVQAATGTGGGHHAAPPATAPVAGNGRVTTFGVLLPDLKHLRQDRAAGVRLVTVGLAWDQWEPSQGQFSASYRNHAREEADRYRAAGMSVAVDPGLQYPPKWVSDLPDGQLLDQHHTGAPAADFAWSQAVRQAATAYLDEVVAAMGPVVDYRVGLSEHGEALYPDTSNNQWWAFTPSAQGRTGGLPAGVSPSPLPGWVPGTPTWRGRPVSQAQVTGWYEWYFFGSVDALAWEMSTIRATGYPGQLELVMPGTGATPALYTDRLGNLLAPGGGGGATDPYFTLNTAAVWWKLLDALPDLTNVAVDISSVGDDSGAPTANGCTGRDASVPLTAPVTASWSDTRWLTYLATAHHLPVMGENPGNTPTSELRNVMNLVTSCHLTALQWAWDDNLYANDGSAAIGQVSSALAHAQEAEGGAPRG
jgi:hypothetical protein